MVSSRFREQNVKSVEVNGTTNEYGVLITNIPLTKKIVSVFRSDMIAGFVAIPISIPENFWGFWLLSYDKYGGNDVINFVANTDLKVCIYYYD